MKSSVALGNFIAGAAGVMDFLERYFKKMGDTDLGAYFAKWTPY